MCPTQPNEQLRSSTNIQIHAFRIASSAADSNQPLPRVVNLKVDVTGGVGEHRFGGKAAGAAGGDLEPGIGARQHDIADVRLFDGTEVGGTVAWSRRTAELQRNVVLPDRHSSARDA